MKKFIQTITGMLLTLLLASGCSNNAFNTHSIVKQEIQELNFSPDTENRNTAIVEIAKQQIGIPYQYGGANPDGFDCSGLAFYSYTKAGLSIPRTSVEQYLASEKIRLSELQPGDLVFFNIPGSKGRHVGIYAGNGKFIHAPSKDKYVSISSLENVYWKANLLAAGRFRQL